MDFDENLRNALLSATLAASHVIGLLNNCATECLSMSYEDDFPDEETDDENAHLMLSCIVCVKESHLRQSGYIQVIESYSDADFWRNLRVTRSTFQRIIHIQKDLKFRSEVIYHGGYEPLTVETMLYIVLVYLANQGAIRLIAEKFGFCESTIWHVVRDECQWFFDNQSLFIRWPSNDDAKSIAREFRRKCGFPGIIGAIDGSHIPISPPSSNRNAYLNYKRFHSIVLMAVCRPNKAFSYTFTGFPGSCHDSYVFQRSSFYGKLDSEDCGQFMDSRKYHLLGDSAFPLKSWMLVPYKDNTVLTESHKLYNKKHSGSRMTIEQAFGDLKNRFRRCQFIDATIPNCVNVIVASCAIHNICIENGDFCIDRDNLLEDLEENRADRKLLVTNSGNAKREMKRTRLSNRNFEMLTFLKVNNKCYHNWSHARK